MRDDWTEATLGDVAEVLDRMRKPVSGAEREKRQGSVPYYGATGQAGWIDAAIFDEELVLLGEDAIDFLNPMVHKAYLISGPSWVNNHAHVLRARKERVLSFFLMEALNAVDYSQFVAFGTRSKLTQGAMMGITINLPPLEEQKRIVDVVSSVDSYIDSLQKQADSARTARNAVLHELLSAGGDDWTETTLGEIIALEYGKPLKAEHRDGKGFPVFGSAGEVGLHSEALVKEAPVIIVGRKGTAGAVWWSEVPCSVIDTAYYVVPKVEINIRFLYFTLGFLDLPSLNAQTGVPGLNRDRAYSSGVLLPPLEEQKRIVEIVSSMDDVIQITENAIVDAKNLRSGLLSGLLSGEHEIPASYDKFLGAA